VSKSPASPSGSDPAPDDDTLVAAARGGDRASLDLLVRRHYDRVYAVCRRVTGHDADAADASQEAMILIVRGLTKFDGRSTFATWSYRIATNASLDELRRKRRRPLVGLAPTGRGDDDEGDLGGDHSDPDSGARIDALGDRILLDQALAALPDDFRIPVVLRDVGGLDYAEIADVIGVPIGTVKSRIARGRAQLASALGDSGNRVAPSKRPTGTS
jgi:RNA polymerase sigma-70 factor (ECF subfamily)